MTEVSHSDVIDAQFDRLVQFHDAISMTRGIGPERPILVKPEVYEAIMAATRPEWWLVNKAVQAGAAKAWANYVRGKHG